MSEFSKFQPDRQRPRRRKWPLWLLLIFLVLCVAFPPLAGKLLESKLKGMIESHLNARLEVDGLKYIPPYRLVGKNFALISGENVKLVEVKKIELLLAELPIHGGPLVIQRLDLDEPA